MTFRLPEDTADGSEHMTVIGRNGSGKSQLSAWALSISNIETKPWYIIDYKGDKLIGQIPWAREVDINEPISRHPGVYVTRPHPGQVDEVEAFLWRIYNQGNTGLYVDEALNMPNRKKAYMALLSQGRSKYISTINVTQRPSYIPVHCFTEANFVSVFHLRDKNDRNRVNEFCPIDFDEDLPKYHSHWYQVMDDKSYKLRPVPDARTILETFAVRLRPKRRMVG